MDPSAVRKCSDDHEYFNMFNGEEQNCYCNRAYGDLFIVPEETRSQVEIEKNTPYD